MRRKGLLQPGASTEAQVFLSPGFGRCNQERQRWGGGILGRGRSPGKGVVAVTGSEARICNEMFSVTWEGNWLECEGLMLEKMGGVQSVRSLQVKLSGRQKAEPMGGCLQR